MIRLTFNVDDTESNFETIRQFCDDVFAALKLSPFVDGDLYVESANVDSIRFDLQLKTDDDKIATRRWGISVAEIVYARGALAFRIAERLQLPFIRGEYED